MSLQDILMASQASSRVAMSLSGSSFYSVLPIDVHMHGSGSQITDLNQGQDADDLESNDSRSTISLSGSSLVSCYSNSVAMDDRSDLEAAAQDPTLRLQTGHDGSPQGPPPVAIVGVGLDPRACSYTMGATTEEEEKFRRKLAEQDLRRQVRRAFKKEKAKEVRADEARSHAQGGVSRGNSDEGDEDGHMHLGDEAEGKTEAQAGEHGHGLGHGLGLGLGGESRSSPRRAHSTSSPQPPRVQPSGFLPPPTVPRKNVRSASASIITTSSRRSIRVPGSGSPPRRSASGPSLSTAAAASGSRWQSLDGDGDVDPETAPLGDGGASSAEKRKQPAEGAGASKPLGMRKRRRVDAVGEGEGEGY